MLAHRLTCRRAAGSISGKSVRQGTLLLPLRVLLWSAGWICTNVLHHLSGNALLSELRRKLWFWLLLTFRFTPRQREA